MRKAQFFFIALVFLYFSSSVLAAPPTVNFTFTPANPGTGQSITFDPTIVSSSQVNNMRWQFGSDGNVNYFGPDINSIVTSDSWTDGDFTSNPTWTDTGGGSWSAATNQLVGGSCSGCTIYTNAFVGPSSNFQVSYKERRDSSNVQGQFKFLTNGTSYNDDGYDLYFDDGGTTGNIVLRKWVSGGLTNLLTVGTQDTGTMYDINIVRTTTGNISVYVNNVLGGTVNDLTYTSGSKILFATGNSAASTHTWDDLNFLTYATTTAPIDTDKNENHTFTTAGTKNVCLTAGNMDGNATTCNSVTVSLAFSLMVFDENLSTPISGATVMIDQNTYTTDVTGTASIQSSNLNFPTTVTVSAPNYDLRSFTYLTQAGFTQDSNVLLRYAPTTQNIDFQFYKPDETTLLLNRLIAVIKNNKIAGRAKTDPNGYAQFNLAPQDTGYRFLIYPVGVDSNVLSIDYNYGPIAVTINRPIDEKTNLSIGRSWSVDLSGLGAAFLDNNSSTKSFTILSNTTSTYNFLVDDSNTLLDLYFPRMYAVNYRGDTNTVSIQPYLVGLTDSGIVTFIIYNKADNTSASNVLVSLRRQISGMSTLVEQSVTNAAGVVGFSFQNAVNYDVNVTDTNQAIGYYPLGSQSGIFNNVLSQYTIYINLTSIDTNIFTPDWNIFTQPDSDNLLQSSNQRFDANVQTNYASSIQIQYFDGNTLIASSSTSNQDLNFTTNIDTTALTGRSVLLVVRIVSGNKIDVYVQSYNISLSDSSLPEGFEALSRNVGVWGGVILTLIILGFVLQQFGPSLVGNNESQIFLVTLVMLACGILFFSNNFLPILIAIAAGFIIYLGLRA